MGLNEICSPNKRRRINSEPLSFTPKFSSSHQLQAKMSQLSRAAMKWSRLFEPSRRRLPPTFFFISSKLFSTAAAASDPAAPLGGGSPDNQFLQTPPTGLVYGKVFNITKHTTKSDLRHLLEGCNLKPENIKVEYNRSYYPLSMMVEFPSRSVYDVALRTILRNGRLFNMMQVDKSEWDTTAPYDGKAILLQGIPRNAFIDDVERFLSGCLYDSSSIQMFVRPTDQGPIRMALVRFLSQPLAMHAYITKNRGFCLNNQITVQVLY